MLDSCHIGKNLPMMLKGKFKSQERRRRAVSALPSCLEFKHSKQGPGFFGLVLPVETERLPEKARFQLQRSAQWQHGDS